jgi:ankyrin repeat protein
MQDSPQLAKATIGEEGVNPLDPGDGNAPSNLIEYKQEGEEGSSPGNIQHSQTSLSWAEMGGQEAVVRLLLEEKGADIEMKDNLGYTALVWASSEGHISTVQQLLEKDAEIEAVDKVYGQTPLSWAAENGHEAVVQLLLEKGADIESKDASGFTPLLWAAYNGRKAVVQLLLKNGANIEAVDKEYGLTPLSWAIEHGRKALVQLLLENKADTKANDICSLTPLVRAASQGNKAIVQLLLEKGANTESNDGSGFTPLLVAARNGSKAVVQLLLENGADIEAKDNEHSRTPLSWAAGNGYKDVVRLLLEKGADTEAKDEHGWTPLSYATQNGRQAIVQLLESLEDFYGEEAGENALDWDGERGWKPVGSLRAVGLYNKGQYTRGQLLSGEWIRIVDTKFCQEFAAQVQQYDSNPWNNLVEYVVIEQVLEYVDVSDGLEYADVEDRVEYLDIDDEATENGEHDIPTTKKLCQSPGCSVEMFSEWPETCTGKLKINVLDLRSRAELCDACDLCYRCLSRHDLGGQEEVTLFQKGSMLTLGTESQPVLEIVARPGSSVRSYQTGGTSNSYMISRFHRAVGVHADRPPQTTKNWQRHIL